MNATRWTPRQNSAARWWPLGAAALVVAAIAWGGVAPSGAARPGDPAAVGPIRPALGGPVTAVLIPPQTPEVLLAGSARGLLASADGGQVWRRLLALRGAELFDIVVAPSHPETIFLATARGLYRSDDGGGHWRRRFRVPVGQPTSVQAVAVHSQAADQVAIGAAQQVMISADGGATWPTVVTTLGLGEIHALLFHPTRPAFLYVLAAEGLARSQDGGQTWDRLLVRHRHPLAEAASDESPVTPAPAAEAAEESPTHLGSLAADPAHPSRLLVGTDRGVWMSEDEGATWQGLPSVGLPQPMIRHLLLIPDDPDRVYAATSEGAFVYSFSWRAWRPLMEGLPSQDIRRLAWSATPRTLWVASRAGLIPVPAPPPAGQEAVAAPPRAPAAGPAPLISPVPLLPAVPDPLVEEPTIQQVQAAAIRYAEVQPGKIAGWRQRAAWRAWLPQFTVALDRDVDQTIASSTSGGKTTFTVGPEDRSIGVDLGFRWELGDLIWNPDQTAIDTRSRLMVQLRGELLDDVTRFYFERRRLQLEQRVAPVADPGLRAERQLRVEELTAQLDALTGGEFSRLGPQDS